MADVAQQFNTADPTGQENQLDLEQPVEKKEVVNEPIAETPKTMDNSDHTPTDAPISGIEFPTPARDTGNGTYELSESNAEDKDEEGLATPPKIERKEGPAASPTDSGNQLIKTKPLTESSRLLQPTSSSSRKEKDSNYSPSRRGQRMTPEEGQARAAARVKIRNMQKKDKELAGGKENDSNRRRSSKKSPRKPTVPQGPNLRSANRSRSSQKEANPAAVRERRNTSHMVKSPSSTKKRSVTRPQSPKFATAQRARTRNAASAMGARAGDDNQSVASRKSVASQSLGATTISSRSTWGKGHQLTVPKGPSFMLDRKYGEKKRDYEKPADERSLASTSTKSSRRSVTVPVAPKFALDARYGEKRAVPKSPQDSGSLAASETSFRKNLRSDDASTASSRQSRPLTVPVAPKFHTTSKRALPKSTEERELEMIANAKPYKARPVPKNTNAPVKPEKVKSPRQTTKAKEPKFSKLHERPKPRSTSELEEEKFRGKKSFKAKPFPGSGTSVTSDTSSKRKLTVPVPPKFNSTSKRSLPKSKLEQDEEEMQKQFKARPMPKAKQ